MGTRAVFTFKDEYASFAVYKHWDGYPEGAAEFLTNAIPLSWGLDRFEADEFAAAFVAANKKKGGDVYMTTGRNGRDAHNDLDYYYEIFPSTKNDQLCIYAYSVDNNGESIIFEGRVKDFVDKYGSSDTKKMWNEYDKSLNKLDTGV
jgi:hypothetical protein